LWQLSLRHKEPPGDALIIAERFLKGFYQQRMSELPKAGCTSTLVRLGSGQDPHPFVIAELAETAIP
jgi:hypothetical protein